MLIHIHYNIQYINHYELKINIIHNPGVYLSCSYQGEYELKINIINIH